MWLNCGSSNNDPGIIAKYYMALRSDHGDELAGAHSHMYGTSTTNQRIESWWSLFRKQRTQFWIKLFSDLRERHLFNGKMSGTLTPSDLRQSCCPSGKPEVMYHLPHRYGGRECGFQVPQEILHQFDHILPAQYSLCGDDNLQVHFTNSERQSELPQPVNWTTAVENYITLKNMTGL
ncbi:hypothetical protein ACER0C_002458 [Sarotherodon galilaeus]